MQNGKERCQKIDYFFFCMVFFSIELSKRVWKMPELTFQTIRGFTNIYFFPKMLLEKEMENMFLFGKAFNHNLIGMFVKKKNFRCRKITHFGELFVALIVELRVSMK